MTSTSNCPSCGRPVQAPDGLRGQLLRCPKCAMIFWATDGRVPSLDEPPPARVEDVRPPWERPGFVRRDCEPHRGDLLAMLATGSIIFGVLSLCLCLPALLALPVGGAVWATARHDLARMRLGEMDPAGLPRTETARDMALGAVLTAGMASLLWGWGLWMHWFA